MKLARIAAYFPQFALGYLRNPLGLFMSLIFPVILILIFGAVFSNTGSTQVPLIVQDLDHGSPPTHAFLAALNSTGTVSITVVGPEVGNLSEYMSHHSLSDGLVIPDGFAASLAARTPIQLTVYSNPSGSSSGIILGAVQGIANGFNLQLAGGSAVVTMANFPVGSTQYHYIDYLVPGLVGFSVLVSPMFSMVNISSTWKHDKLFRQLSLTPLTRGEWLVATLLWYVLLAVVSAGLLVGVGTLAFGARVTVTWMVLPFLAVGPILFVSIGLLAGSVSKTPETAGVIGNIITFPMMFLSGTFFPIAIFPAWLATVAHGLPLFYVIDGLNAGMIYDNPSAVLFDLVIVLVLAVGFAVAASRVFSWREE